jgi:hypothetical protein
LPEFPDFNGLNFPAKLKTVQISWHYHSKIKTKFKLPRSVLGTKLDECRQQFGRQQNGEKFEEQDWKCPGSGSTNMRLEPTPRIINIFPNPRRRKWKLAPVESLLDSDVELFTEDHKTRLPGARTPAELIFIIKNEFKDPKNGRLGGDNRNVVMAKGVLSVRALILSSVDKKRTPRRQKKRRDSSALDASLSGQ